MDTPIMLIKDPLCNNLVTIRKTIQINEIKIYDKKREKIKGSISLDNFFRDLHEDAVWNDENNTPFRAIDYDEYDEKSGFPGKAIVEEEKNKDRRTYGVVKIQQTDEVDGMPAKELSKGKEYFIKYGTFKVEEKSPGYYQALADKTEFIQYNHNSKMITIKRPKYNTTGIIIHNENWKLEKLIDTEKPSLIGFLTIFQSIASHHIGASEEDIRCDYSNTNGNVYILDSSAGGNGVSFQIVKELHTILKSCKTIIEGCKCKSGCFSCIWPKYSDLEYSQFVKKDVIDLIIWFQKVTKNVDISTDFR